MEIIRIISIKLLRIYNLKMLENADTVAFFIATLMLVTDVGDKHDGNKFEILMTDVAIGQNLPTTSYN